MCANASVYAPMICFVVHYSMIRRVNVYSVSADVHCTDEPQYRGKWPQQLYVCSTPAISTHYSYFLITYHPTLPLHVEIVN